MRRSAILLIVGIVFFSVWQAAAGVTLASTPALPPRPTAHPPPPTVTATPVPAVDENVPRAGALIELRAPAAPRTAWSVVQWQDATGDWHDVDGWQGPVIDGVRRWWVAPNDFRTGPFRWMLYTERAGDRWTASEPFYLPTSSYEIVVVPVSVR